jgi:hypothetical protein
VEFPAVGGGLREGVRPGALAAEIVKGVATGLRKDGGRSRLGENIAGKIVAGKRLKTGTDLFFNTQCC